MRRRLVRLLATVLLATPLTVIARPGQAATPDTGGQVFASGGNVIVEVLPAEAGSRAS